MEKINCMTCNTSIGVDVCYECDVFICVACLFGAIEEEHLDNCRFS